MMFDIAFFILFCVMAYRIARAIYLESKIFQEFKQSRMLALLVMLFPFGSLLLFASVFHLPLILAFVGAAACFIPALIAARKLGHAFEIAGTDRVKGAKAAVSQAFGIALVGLIYVSINLLFVITSAAIN